MPRQPVTKADSEPAQPDKLSLMKVTQNIGRLPMVGPTYAKRLEKLAIKTVEDLLFHFPHRHDDFRLISQISQIQPGETVTVHGQIISSQNIYTRKGIKIQKALIADPAGQIEATWFNQPYITQTLKPGLKVALSGKVDTFGFKVSFSSPEYEIITSSKQQVKNNLGPIHTSRLVPIYPETRGVSSKWLRSRIAPLLDQIDSLVSDWLPSPIIKKQKLLDLSTSLRQVHFPDSLKTLQKARHRLAFDELFLLQLASQKRKYLWAHKKLSHPLSVNQEKVTHFIAGLPFTLTKAQTQSIKQILSDLRHTNPMNRLLQGDVGSGKTVVAAVAMYVSFLNDLKSALMAPTEILALQHAKTIKTLLEPLGLTISTQTSSVKDKRKNPDILIGTHALLYRDIPPDLALLVVDEQHRFGVEQRAQLLKAPKTPHLLAMTATPIPRTVALTVYGELDLSVIDEMPQGRKPVKTWVVPKKKRASAYKWIADQINKDKTQAFVVCPLIEESTADSLSQVKAAETEYEFLKTNIFPQIKLGLLHGRMKAKQKKIVIGNFRNKKLHLLVSTPVIEVGIDIPNATIMIIEGAERFGLSQLHQLRGRVGRGEAQSYCLLFTSTQKQESLQRLKSMESESSGFKLAELDLKLRGPGEMHGIKQHGFTQLKIASFSDQKLITQTHTIAKKLIALDPQLVKHPPLSKKLASLLKRQIEPN